MKTLFSTFFLMLAVSSFAQNTDERLTVVRPDSVVFLTKDNKLQVTVNGNDENHDYVYCKEVSLAEGEPVITSEHTKNWDFTLPFFRQSGGKRPRYKYIMSGICFGWNTAVNAPEGMDIDMGESFEIMCPHIIGWNYSPAGGRLSYSVGIGLNWRNFRMTGKTRFIKNEQGITFGEYPQNAEIQFSRLKVFSWIVPLTVNYDLSDNLCFTFGPIINFNTYSSLKTRYRIEGQKHKDFDKRASQCRTTIDLFASLHLHSIGVYVKYNPCNVLKSDFAPSFNAFSAGVTLFY